LNIKRGQNVKYLPFAFTELGVAMLSSVLRSPAAIKVNRDSTRAQLAAINDALTELQSLKSQNVISKPHKPIGFIQPEDDEDIR
jgi:hypothetical protein